MTIGQNPPANHPIAVLSDIHGNLPALEAAIADIEQRGVKEFLALGDHVLGGDAPLDVWRLLQKVGARCTSGMSDKALVRVDPKTLTPKTDKERALAEMFAKTRDTLGDLVVEQLRRLPDSIRIPLIDGTEIVATHGCPGDATVELSHDMDDEELLAALADDPADIVLTGASHVPFVRVVEGIRIVNVGSIGSAPEGRYAHYTIVTPAMSGAEIEQFTVEY